MDNKTIGAIVFLLGLVSFLQSFNLTGTSQIAYFVVGLILVLGGLIYARKK